MKGDNNSLSMQELKDEKGQKIIFLNTRSLINHISELQTEFNRTKFTALGFCETWLNNIILSGLINIEGYRLTRIDRLGKKRGGGLLCT